jgi:hypothetical protein
MLPGQVPAGGVALLRAAITLFSPILLRLRLASAEAILTVLRAEINRCPSRNETTALQAARAIAADYR